MTDYKIKNALGNKIIVEPVDKSTVLKTTETETVFKVISVGDKCDLGEIGGTYIIVESGSVEKTYNGHKEVFYIIDTSAIAVVENG